MFKTLYALFILLPLISLSTSLFSGEVKNHINYIGRWSFDEKAPTSSWPGSAIEAFFQGSEISFSINHQATAKDIPVFWVILLDNQTPIRIQGKIGKDKYFVANNLDKNKTHFIKILRDTEGSFGITQFYGFDFGSDGHILPFNIPKNALAIEAIGDSITVGYGNLSSTPHCSNEPIWSSNYMSYSSIAARRLNAELTTIAYSGQGMYRNYRGDIDSDLTPTIPRYYMHTLTPLIFPDDLYNHYYDFSTSTNPDIVVINIGTNDFAIGIPTFEQFATPYLEMLKQIRKNYPQSQIFITCGQMLRDESNSHYGPKLSTIRSYLNKITSSLNDSKIHTFEIDPINSSIGYGCAYHPRSIDNHRVADALINAIKKVMDIKVLDYDPQPLFNSTTE